jgi:hypothetical protein
MPRRLSRQERIQLGARQVAVAPPSVPSPIKGWNTRDALTAMDPLDAVQLDNWYPDTTGLNLRNGYVSYATGMGSSPVKTLAEYNAGATRKFLAASGGKIYDISAGGAVGAALASGFSSDAWQTEQFLSKLLFCNGADTMQTFDGTTVAASTFTGVTLSTLVGAKQYQQRLFFWQNNSTGFYFAPLNSISGALSFYDLSPFSPGGGNLVAVATYSHDGGNGVLDFIVFILSSGWALIFYGNDPATLDNWQEIGRYRIAPPVNIRSVVNYGGEAFVTTFDDHIPLSAELQALTQGRLAPRGKISTAVQAAVAANASAFGWQALYYTKGRRLIFNIPNPDGTFSQHVQNMAVSYPDPMAERVTSPWCRFVNMNAQTWGLFKDNLFFGGANGTVYQADTGSLDLLGPIHGTAQQAWNTFEQPYRKRLTDVRPIIQSFGQLNYSFSVGFDYASLNITDQVATSAVGSPWDTSPWDTSLWSSEFSVSTLWRGAGGDGVAAGWSISASANIQ